MGEIKSTLDLVMEKTKHLSLSEEEKILHNKEMARKKINGLLQKYQDTLISLEEMKKELMVIQKEYAFAGSRFIATNIMDKITLTQDKDLLLNLLSAFFNTNLDQLESVFKNYQTACNEKAINKIKEKKIRLEEKHQVSGSAVIPNLDADETWADEVKKLTEYYGKQLEREKKKAIEALQSKRKTN